MKKDLLLINPPITLEERYGSFASVGSQAPPLGLCYIAATVRQASYSVQILDAPAFDMDLPRTITEIARANAELNRHHCFHGLNTPGRGTGSGDKTARALPFPILIGRPPCFLPSRQKHCSEFKEFDIGVLMKANTPYPRYSPAIKMAGRSTIFRALSTAKGLKSSFPRPGPT